MELIDTLNRIADKLDEIADKLDGKATTPKNTQTFDEFARYYFDTYRKRKVAPKTFKCDLSRYELHIAPTIGGIRICELVPEQVQKLIDSLSDRPKTAHEVFGLINLVCKTAIRHHLILSNPCDIVILPDYERKHGKALTHEEERRLLHATGDTPYQLMFAVILYTGLRPNEYATARLEGDFIVARNSKQKDGKEHTKRIAITPMLAPYITASTVLHFYAVNRIGEKLRAILPNHKLYDLRTTFYTRCQERGVSELARNLFVGHSLGKLANTYTDVSDDYLIAEAQKVKY